jgi:hypothetical protein
LLFAQPAHGGAVSRQTGRAAAAETVPVIPEKPAPRTRKTWETSAAETPKAADARVTAKAALRFGDISSENLARAVVWSEILGAPRAVRPFGRPNR